MLPGDSRRAEIIGGPAAVAKHGQGVSQPLFPVSIGGARANGCLDRCGGAGAERDDVDKVVVALLGVVPALHGGELVGGCATGDRLAVGCLPFGAIRVAAGIGVLAVAGLETVEYQRPAVARREVGRFGRLAQPSVVIECRAHGRGGMLGEAGSAHPGGDDRGAGGGGLVCC